MFARASLSRALFGRATCTAIILVVLVCGRAPSAQASAITLQYSGSIDLTPFGGSTATPFAGTVTWDPDVFWDSSAPPGCPADFCLNGTPGAVSGTFLLDSVDYTDRIEPISRFLVFGWGGLALDLYFTPAIDVDGGLAPDIGFMTWVLGSDPNDYSLFVDNTLPTNGGFRDQLPFRRFQLWDTNGGGLFAEADTFSFTVIPEPATTMLFVLGVSAAGIRTRRVRQRRCGPGRRSIAGATMSI
jgi:hypothetical protein